MTDLITRLEEAADMKCPKCNARSGDDWEQCKGSCPLPGSPYFESQPQGQAMTDRRSEAMSAETLLPWGSCKTCNSERPSSPCWKCGGEVNPVAAGWEWPDLNDIGRIRELAREVGYAVGVHGSMQRDQDLIAVPWVADAVDPLALAQHIAAGLGGQVVDYQTQDKPCGRWSCNIHTPEWTKLIDLSVMPPSHPPQPDALPGDLRERVAAVLYENIGATSWGGDAEVHGIPEATDAILSLIQSERGGA